MSTASLRQLLDVGIADGGVLCVSAQVSTENASAIAYKAAARWGKPTLFSAIGGHSGWAVASHLLTSRQALARIMGVEAGCPGLVLSQRLAGYRPARGNEGDGAGAPRFAADEVLDDMARLPLLHQSAGWEHAEWSGIALCGGRAVLLRGRVEGKNLRFLDVPASLRTLLSAGSPAPCILVGGAHPAFYLVAALALGMPELGLDAAAALSGAPMETVQVDGQRVPADAEYVVAGDLEGGSWIFRPSRLLRGEQPVHLALSCHDGVSEMGSLLGLATEILLARQLANVEGGLDLIDICTDPQIGPLMAVVKLRGRVMGQTKTALMSALSSAAYWVRSVILVDEDVRADDMGDVFWSMSSRADLGADLLLLPGMPVVDGDRFARGGGWMPEDRAGLRWGIDSCMPPVSMPAEREAFQRAVPHNYPGAVAGAAWI